jgi:hypothetical protein
MMQLSMVDMSSLFVGNWCANNAKVWKNVVETCNYDL